MIFLHSRTQVTKVGCHVSQCVSLTSGVVQGSCLGPLLFLVYINDLVAVFNINVTPELYADDLKFYASLSCPIAQLQIFRKNLDWLTEWASVWQLTISVKKCCITQVGSKQKARDGPHTHTPHQSVLSQCIAIRGCYQRPWRLNQSVPNFLGAHRSHSPEGRVPLLLSL